MQERLCHCLATFPKDAGNKNFAECIRTGEGLRSRKNCATICSGNRAGDNVNIVGSRMRKLGKRGACTIVLSPSDRMARLARFGYRS